MTVTYELTADDFREGFAAHRRQQFLTKWLRRSIGGMAVVVLCLYAGVWISNSLSPDHKFANLLLNLQPLAILMAIWLALLIFMPSYAARKQYKSNPSAHGSIEMIADTSGMKFNAPSGQSTRTWSSYVKWVETKTIFSLYSSNALFQPIPKRAMSPGQIDEFRVLLQAHVVSAR